MDVLRFKQANCKNCYKCVRFCPVKSIRVYQGHAQIISSDCILCGNCVSVCPQHAKEDISDVAQIQELIASGHQVVVSVDSSYIAYFDTPGFAGIAEPLKKLGFAAAHETAEGAYLVKKELEKLAAQPGDAPIITSGCSTIVLYVEKHLPEALPYLAPVLSPMQAHAVLLRKRYPGATIVYVNPCISKKEETTRFESVGADYDITFTELEDWMHEAGVAVNPNVPADEPLLSRGYTITNGVLHSMSLDSGRDYLFLDGLDDSIQTLKSVVNGELRNCFIEIAACHGNCVGGLAFRQKHTNLLESRRRVIKSAGGGKNFDIQEPVDMRRVLVDKKHPTDLPPESVINGILRKMGKFSPADELNCGLCGYRTCRDKAIAVYEGRAEISMCMPYMKERAETYSEKIINVSPEGIVTVGKKLKVKQINKAACKIFGIKDPADIIGYPVSRIMDEYNAARVGTVMEVLCEGEEPETGRYRLTLKMFELSSGIVDSMDIMGVAKAHLERLSQRTGEAVHLVIRDGRDIVYIYKTESGPMRMSSRVGLRSPLYCTGVGKAILATLPGDELEDIWTHSNVQKLTDKTITDLEELRSQLVEVRANGYAIENGEYKIGLRSVSAPVYTVEGKAAYAVGVIGMFRSPHSEEFHAAVEQVCVTASMISTALGYRKQEETL